MAETIALQIHSMGKETTLTIISWGVLMISSKYLSKLDQERLLVALTKIKDEASLKSWIQDNICTSKQKVANLVFFEI